jgi:hypothetical protein
MRLTQRIVDDMKEALKSGDRLRLGVLRMLKAKLQEREVELRSRHGRNHVLDDDEALGVLSRYAKQRKDSIEGFRQGGREEQAEREEAELAIVESYLPQQLGEDEIRELVAAAIREAGATSPRDMGEVMKRVMPGLKGRADGKIVKRLAVELLTPAEEEPS